MRGIRWIAGSAILGLTVLLWPLAASAQAPDPVALELVNNLNMERQAQGLPIFNLQAALTSAAAEQASNMVALAAITHTGVDGSTVYDRVARAGYAGEVVEVVYGGPNGATAMLEWWRNTDLAASTLLNPSYQDIGIGATPGNDGWTYWAVVMGRPVDGGGTGGGRSAEISPTLPPTPLPPLTAASATAAPSLPSPTNIPVLPPTSTPPVAATVALSAPLSPTPWPATFTPVPTRTPRPTETPLPIAPQRSQTAALVADVRGAAVRLADNVAAVRPTTSAPVAPAAAFQIPAEQTDRFDPVPLIVGLVALIGAGGLVYLGYQPASVKRDPFRR